jgi:hypothetical protein
MDISALSVTGAGAAQTSRRIENADMALRSRQVLPCCGITTLSWQVETDPGRESSGGACSALVLVRLGRSSGYDPGGGEVTRNRRSVG